MRQHRTWSGIAVALLLTSGVAGTLSARAQTGERVEVPADTVVRLKLDEALNSRDAKRGDPFAAVLSPDDRSGFPAGTRFQGAVREVQRHTEDQPGILDVAIRRAFLPDGQKVNLEGRLASLAKDDVKHRPDGRLEAKKPDKKVDWKWAGYGAGAGAVLSAIFGGKLLKGVLLGGLGGAIYGYLNRKSPGDAYRDVDLPRGTEFGVRLEQQVAFRHREGYRYAGRSREPEEQVAGEREATRYESATVYLNGKAVELNQRPVEMNGSLYVPLEPIAQAAGMRLTRRPGEDGFALETPAGRAQADAGERSVTLENGERITLAQPPIVLNGTLCVTPEYLGRVAGMRADWDAVRMRLDLATQQ